MVEITRALDHWMQFQTVISPTQKQKGKKLQMKNLILNWTILPFPDIFRLGGLGDDKGVTLDGIISTAGEGRCKSLSDMEDVLWLPRSGVTNPGKHWESNAGARIVTWPSEKCLCKRTTQPLISKWRPLTEFHDISLVITKWNWRKRYKRISTEIPILTKTMKYEITKYDILWAGFISEKLKI